MSATRWPAGDEWNFPFAPKASRIFTLITRFNLTRHFRFLLPSDTASTSFLPEYNERYLLQIPLRPTSLRAWQFNRCVRGWAFNFPAYVQFYAKHFFSRSKTSKLPLMTVSPFLTILNRFSFLLNISFLSFSLSLKSWNNNWKGLIFPWILFIYLYRLFN